MGSILRKLEHMVTQIISHGMHQGCTYKHGNRENGHCHCLDVKYESIGYNDDQEDEIKNNSKAHTETDRG